MTDNSLARYLPTDDEVWRERHRTWADWAGACGVSVATVSREMTRRGWVRVSRGIRGELLEAPCSECGESFRVGAYQVRLCASCRDVTEIEARAEAGERLTLAEERKLYLARREQRKVG